MKALLLILFCLISCDRSPKHASRTVPREVLKVLETVGAKLKKPEVLFYQQETERVTYQKWIILVKYKIILNNSLKSHFASALDAFKRRLPKEDLSKNEGVWSSQQFRAGKAVYDISRVSTPKGTYIMIQKLIK